MKSVPVLLSTIMLASCSYKGVYENIQLNRHNECMQEPPGRYESCMDRIDKSYREYEKDLEEYQRERKAYAREKENR